MAGIITVERSIFDKNQLHEEDLVTVYRKNEEINHGIICSVREDSLHLAIRGGNMNSAYDLRLEPKEVEDIVIHYSPVLTG